MNQTYVYRKHLRAPLKYLIFIELIIFIGVVLMITGQILTDDLKSNGYLHIIIVVILVIFLFITIELGILYLIFFRRFKSISVTLGDEAIVYTNSKKQIIIPYEDIQELKFPSIKYTGGWLKIIYRGGNIRLTVVLEQIGVFIGELKEKLDERAMPQVYNENKLFSFFKTSVFSDESWERVYHNFKIQIAIHYLCIILTTAILLFFGSSDNNQIFIYGSLFAPLLGYLFSEIIIGMKVKKRVLKEEFRILPRNSKLEYNIFMISILASAIGYLLVLVLVLM